jgi:hypothetical protein
MHGHGSFRADNPLGKLKSLPHHRDSHVTCVPFGKLDSGDEIFKCILCTPTLPTPFPLSLPLALLRQYLAPAVCCAPAHHICLPISFVLPVWCPVDIQGKHLTCSIVCLDWMQGSREPPHNELANNARATSKASAPNMSGTCISSE